MPKYVALVIGDGARCALMAVFLLSALEKGNLLWRRAATWHPTVMTSVRRRRRAVPLMLAALITDMLILLGLAITPSTGARLAALTIVFYSVAARHMTADPAGASGS
jgi:hypothetical protein